MKIAQVFGSLNPGGAEKQAANITVRLREMGHDVTVILPHGPGDMSGNLEPFMGQHHVPMISTMGRRDKTAALTNVFRHLRPDVVVSNGYPMTLHGTMAAWGVNVPVRVVVHADTGFTRAEFPQTVNFEREANERVTAFVGNSLAVFDSLAAHPGVDLEKRHVIRNGVSIPEIAHQKVVKARKHWGARKETVVIGYLANFRPDGLKNQLMLVRAAARIVREYKDCLFVMAGYPSEYTEVVQHAVSNFELVDHFYLPGRIDDLDLLAGWDIGVNCSHTEGLSNAVMECMAYGMPVVATHVGGNSEITPLLVPDDDDAAMANALIALIEKPDQRRSFGQAGRNKMAENCSWEVILQQWLDLFNEGLEAAHA